MDPNTSQSNRNLLDLNRIRQRNFALDPARIYPWFRRPCPVRLLLVTDGALDFGSGDFGLSTFVHILQNDAPGYARFELTLAHLRSDVSNVAVMEGAAGIVRSIKGFRFDEPGHFDAGMYDEVWLFGFETYFHYPSDNNINTPFYAERLADPARYPATRLGDGELAVLSAFMDNRGGVFATGDHGALGLGLCGEITRVRGMRHWNSFLDPVTGQDEVSMSGVRRNDTNQIGHDAGSSFSDQSDDVPQTIEPRLYSSWAGFFRHARYPHPVLCGSSGRITVLPDHPHEGECRIPPDLTLSYPYSGTTEYPPALDGSGQVVPEVIATSRVPAGNDARASKQPTVAHSFGAISAYDGHRAGVGRVICDATWHHFVNVNLIGVVEGKGFDEFNVAGEDASKHDGFLSSAAGRAVLDKIKNYYTNIGVWIARPENLDCFRNWFWWRLTYLDRIMEATLLDPNVKFDQIKVDHFLSIGIHARDVLGRAASQCQAIDWVIDWVRLVWPEIVPWIDPWDPLTYKRQAEFPMLPVIDPMPLIDVALGGALVAMRQAFPYPSEKMAEDFDKHAREAAMGGARAALDLGLQNGLATMRTFGVTTERLQNNQK